MEASSQAYQHACKVIPGGVNSPVRAFGAVSGTPLFITSGEGARITDLDKNEYIDYVCSWGPLILGHAPEQVLAAVSRALNRGCSFGAPTTLETELAELIVDLVPSAEMVRFVNSGTEATMSALRLARAYTGKDLIIKVTGGYHGHVDSLLVSAGSGAMTLGTPSSPGVPQAMADLTILVPFNDVTAVTAAFEKHGANIAGMIIEPVAGNMGVVPPADGYLEALRSLCDQYDAVLIFDEVMSGFRVAPGGAQELYKVTPDMTCLGKVIGGGLPVGAYCGRTDIMKLLSPAGKVYQAGTLSGNPLAMAAGVATLRELSEAGTYEQLEKRSDSLETGLAKAAAKADIPVTINRVGSMMTVFFTDQPVCGYDAAAACDTTLFARFFHEMLQRRVYLPASQFEAWFISTAHQEADIKDTCEAAAEALAALHS